MKIKKLSFPLSRTVCFTLLLVFLAACSTQKNNFTNRTYHTINAKYNGYFNARESYREGLQRLSDMHQDNYEEVLRIFRYGTPQQAASVNSQMEVAYQKASIVIRRHSMNIRGVEYNPFVERAHFLIARTHFFRREFNLAVLSFEYIIRQYDTDISDLAMVWLVKSYHEQERFELAAQLLDQLGARSREGLLSREADALYHLVKADHHIRKDHFPAAAAKLAEGIPMLDSRRERARLSFILAQLYHHAGDYATAQQAYARVLRMNPTFDLAFQARIGMAMAFDPATGDSDYVRNELGRMLRDDRNKNYQDQIYYALAQMAMRQGRTAEAKELFLQSAHLSVDNDQQKGVSYLRLGEIHFDAADYLSASLYYDSATTYLPSSFESYPEINRRRSTLSALANNFKTIEREDSLQRLVAKSETEQLRVVDGIIAALREKDAMEAAGEREMEQAMRDAARQARQQQMGGQRDAGWYFYNPTAISQGRTEFFGRFGNRPLEDLWRISDRRMTAFDEFMDDMQPQDDLEEEGGRADPYTREYYLRHLPLTPEMLVASDERIALAYYNKGMLFKDRLADHEASLSSLETLIRRFPGSDHELYALYHLYGLAREMNLPAQAAGYKQRLIDAYPDSEFAAILGDPDYLEKWRAREREVEALYRQAYEAFMAKAYQEVLDLSDRAAGLSMDETTRSRFAYLEALALGATGQRSAFRQSLEYIVNRYDNQMVYQPAAHLLASLDATLDDYLDEEEMLAAESADSPREIILPAHIAERYQHNPDLVHFVVFSVDTRRADPLALREEISQFNDDTYREQNLGISSIFLHEGKQILTVTNFPDQDQGMRYYRAVRRSSVASRVDEESVHVFLISVENYPVFYQDKNLDDYLLFFQAHYLNR